MPFCQTITDLTANRDLVRTKRYGVIETSAAKLTSLTLRPWPKSFSMRELIPVTDRWKPRGPADQCRLYYNQPRGHSSFIALRYVECTEGTSYATFRAALAVLDEVAAIKASHALLCDAANSRLSERFLKRQGWEPHAPQWMRRNFIKRFDIAKAKPSIAITQLIDA